MAEMALATENLNNNLERWRAALSELAAARQTRQRDEAPRPFNVNVVCILDTSGSMAGKRINAMKLALCALISELDGVDRVSLLSFNSVVQDLSGGFISPTDLRPMLPGLLVGMRAGNSTAFYDAILVGLDKLAAVPQQQPVGDTQSAKNIILALTDGEDTCSRKEMADVVARLRIPNIENFQFMTVAVDLEGHVLTALEPLAVYTHTKLIEVTVRTGRRLIGVFGETVLLRMLREEDEGDFSFFKQARGMILRDGCAEGPVGPAAARLPPRDLPPAYTARAVSIDMSSDDEDDAAEAHAAFAAIATTSRARSSVRSSSPMMQRCRSRSRDRDDDDDD